MNGYITFRSVTPAQRAESLLQRAGMGCVIQRTPRWMAEQGCGYSLRLRPADIPPAVQLLRENNTQFIKVYRKKENGSFEEMTL